MKNLIFVGGGGYFLELFEYISTDIAEGRVNSLSIYGFLDDKIPSKIMPCPYLGNIENYEVQPEDIFIVAIGNVFHRKKIFTMLKYKSASFYTYKHSSAIVSLSAKIGEGSIVCPFTIINANAIVEENVSLNVHVSIGHEASVGAHSVVSPYAALNGNSSIGEQSFIGTRSTVFPSIKVGAFCTVDSHVAVRKSCEEKMLLSERTTFSAIKNRFMR